MITRYISVTPSRTFWPEPEGSNTIYRSWKEICKNVILVDFKGEEEVYHEMNGRKGTEDSVSMSSKMGLGRLLEAEKSGKILFFLLWF